MHPFPRSARLADLIHRELASTIMYEIKDPRVAGLVTVVEVEVSPDLHNAKVFVSVLGGGKASRDGMAALKRARGFITRELFHRLKIKRVPALSFILDQRLEDQARIERLLASSGEPGEGEAS